MRNAKDKFCSMLPRLALLVGRHEMDDAEYTGGKPKLIMYEVLVHGHWCIVRFRRDNWYDFSLQEKSGRLQSNVNTPRNPGDGPGG